MLFRSNGGHGAQGRCCPGVSRRWRVRHLASAGHLKRRSAPVKRGRQGRSTNHGSGARVLIRCPPSPHRNTTNEIPPTLGTERGVDPRHARRAYNGSHPERTMKYHNLGGYLRGREVTAVLAARATPAMGLEVREVGPIQTPRHRETAYLPATTVPPTVVALRPKKGGNRRPGPISPIGN